MWEAPRLLIPQTATFTRSLAPMILPEDLVPLIAKVAKAEDWVRKERLVCIIFTFMLSCLSSVKLN
jgi:hypothetical protein